MILDLRRRRVVTIAMVLDILCVLLHVRIHAMVLFALNFVVRIDLTREGILLLEIFRFYI